MIQVVCISDTHSLELEMITKVPDGDILLHAGDLMNSGYDFKNVFKFLEWFSAFPHKHKIFIAGNHDRYFQSDRKAALNIIKSKNDMLKAAKGGGVIYLEEESVEVMGLNIYGSPWTPWFRNWAFNLPHPAYNDSLAQTFNCWEKIPDNTDIVITHGPPKNILDKVVYGGHNVGCPQLAERIKAIRPLMHLFGHIHEAYGTHFEGNTAYVNASICTLQYKPINKPKTFLIDKERLEVYEL